MTISEQQRWRRAKEIFEAACDGPAASQRGIVEEMAGEDASLAAVVWQLLAIHDLSGLTLDARARPLASEAFASCVNLLPR